jgi:predicted aconitase with swiveling domain
VTKASLLALAILGLPVAPASALPLLYEPFDYPVTDANNNSGLTETDTEAYTAGGGYTAPNTRTWQPTGYGSGANLLSPNYDKVHDVVLISPGLIVPGLNPGGAGNAASYGGPGYTARIDIRPSGLNAEDITPTSTFSNVVYYSLAFRITDITNLQAVGGPLAAFNNSVGQQANNPTVLAGRTNIRPDPAASGGYQIGLIKAQDGTSIFDAAVYPLNTQHFVVVKYDFNGAAGSDDVATMWIDPSPSTYGGLDPTTGTIITNPNGTDVASDVIRSFILRQGNISTVANPAGVIADELRVGTTYADVTTIPEPSAVALAGLVAAGCLARRRRS